MLNPSQYVEHHLNLLDKYLEGILSGATVCGKLELKAVERFIKYKEQYLYKESEVKKVLKFFSLLNYAPNQQLMLVDWQVFALANLYGLYLDDSTRLFNFAYIECSKKQGKTSFVSAIILYETLLDNTYTTNNYLLASAREQARIALDYAKLMIENSNYISGIFTINRNLVYNKGKGYLKKFEVKASDSNKLQGIKGDFIVVDEYGAHENGDLLYKAKSSMIASNNPLLVAITTAYSNLQSPAYELRQTAVNILNEVIEDKSLFTLIFSLDSKEEMNNPELWRKSNPSLGVTVTLDALLKEYETAKNIPSKLTTFLTDNLNIWIDDQAENWIDDEIIIEQLTDEIAIPHGAEIYVGMDLSSNRDLAAIAVTYFDKEQDRFINKIIHIFPNNDKRRIKKGSIDLQRWIDDGYIIRCQTPVLDDELIFQLIEKLNQEYSIKAIGYDKWNASIIANRLQNQLGLTLNAVSQTVGSLSFPLRIMESFILNKKYFINRSPVSRWQFQNVKLYKDINNNIKLDKRKGESIDGIVALNIAMHQYLEDHYNEFNDMLNNLSSFM